MTVLFKRLTVFRFLTVPLLAVHGIAEFDGTFLAVSKNDGTFETVDGFSKFDGTFLAVLQNDGTAEAVPVLPKFDGTFLAVLKYDGTGPGTRNLTVRFGGY